MPDIAMVPGDKRPGRYRKHVISGALVALIAAGASQTQIFDQFTGEKEGDRLTSYQDGSARIWTVCRGLTRIDGIAVKPHMTLTREQCAFYNKREATRSFAVMERLTNKVVWEAMSAPARVGTTDFCVYQIGEGKCKDSKFLRELNAGHVNEACAEITRWIHDQKKDCRKAGSNCQGQPIRRMQEDELCLTVDAP